MMTGKELSILLRDILEQQRQADDSQAGAILRADIFEDLGYRYLNHGLEVKCSDGKVFQINIVPIV